MPRNAEVARVLLPGSEIKDCRVERVLAVTELALTYLAEEIESGKTVVIQEYFPTHFARRTENGGVSDLGKSRESSYRWGLEQFVSKARKLCRLNHPGLARVQRVFRARGTAYAVIAHQPGETLEDKLGRGTISEDELRAMVEPILGGLALMHVADQVHGDIRPDNIIIGADGGAVLAGYSLTPTELVRQRQPEQTTAAHYSPLELLSSSTELGPPADIYSLGAVMYRSLTGKLPPPSLERAVDDTLVPAVTAAAKRAGTGFLRAIDRALAVKTSERPSDIGEFRELLDHAGEPNDSQDDAQGHRTRSGFNAGFRNLIRAFARSSAGKRKSGLLARLGHAMANVAHAVRRHFRRRLGIAGLLSGLRAGLLEKWRQISAAATDWKSPTPGQPEGKRSLGTSLGKLARSPGHPTRRRKNPDKRNPRSPRMSFAIGRFHLLKRTVRKPAQDRRKTWGTRIGIWLSLIGSVVFLYLLWDGDVARYFKNLEPPARGVTVSLKQPPWKNAVATFSNPRPIGTMRRLDGFLLEIAGRRPLRKTAAATPPTATPEPSTAAGKDHRSANRNTPPQGAVEKPAIPGGAPDAGNLGRVQSLLQGLFGRDPEQAGPAPRGHRSSSATTSLSQASRQAKTDLRRSRRSAQARTAGSDAEPRAMAPPAMDGGGAAASAPSNRGPNSQANPAGQGAGGGSDGQGKATAQTTLAEEASQSRGSSAGAGEKLRQAAAKPAQRRSPEKPRQAAPAPAAPRSTGQRVGSRNTPPRNGESAVTGAPPATARDDRGKNVMDQAKGSQKSGRHGRPVANPGPGTASPGKPNGARMAALQSVAVEGTPMPEAPVNAGQPNLSAANSPADDTGGTKAPEPPPGPNNIGHLRGSSRSAPSDAGAMKAPARRLGWDSAGEIASADQTPRRQGTAEAVQATPPRGGAPVTVQAASPRGSRDTAAMERGGSAAAGPAAGANRRQASRKTRTAAAPSITGGPVPGARVLGRSGDHEKLFRALGVSDGFGPDVLRSRMMTVIVLDRGDAEVKRRFEAILMTGESAETAAYNPDLLVANGPDDLARAFNNLAGLYHQARDTAAAEILYRRAIDLWRKSEEKNSHLMATGFNNLAELYRAQGRQDQAAPLFKRAIDILSAPNTKPSPGLAAALQNLALIHHWRRDTERAELLYRKALDVAQGIGPAGRQVARATRRNYALLLRNMGRGEEAAKIEAAN